MTPDEDETEFFWFEKALEIMKRWGCVTRSQFRDTCKIRAHFPDNDTENTLPYLQMEKWANFFPVDLSCESIFANDWYQV